MKIFYKTIILALFTLVVLFLNIEGTSATTLDEKKQIASQVFPAPGAKWEVFEQPFWKHSVIFHLTSVSDPRWYHRPFVAVDEKDKGYLLSDGALKVSSSLILENFNDLALKENLEIPPKEEIEYALFFAKVFGLASWDNEDRKSDLTTQKDEQRRKESQKFLDKILLNKKDGIRVLISSADDSIRYSWFEGEYSVYCDAVIHRNGTIALREKKWQKNTK